MFMSNDLSMTEKKKNLSFVTPVARLIDGLAAHWLHKKGHSVVVSAAMIAFMRLTEDERRELVKVASGFKSSTAAQIKTVLSIDAANDRNHAGGSVSVRTSDPKASREASPRKKIDGAKTVHA
jgi:hypothetical protein